MQTDTQQSRKVFPCKRAVFWQGYSCLKPARLTIDVSHKDAPVIELKSMHFISSGNEVIITPETLCYRPGSMVMETFLLGCLRVARVPELTGCSYLSLSAEPQCEIVSEAYRDVQLRLDPNDTFRSSLVIDSLLAESLHFPFFPDRRVKYRTADGKPMHPFDVSHGAAKSVISALLAAMGD